MLDRCIANRIAQAVVSVVAAGILAFSAGADTIFFKDGSSLDGTVIDATGKTFVLEVEDGRLYFDTSEVELWEENDRTARYNLFTTHSGSAETGGSSDAEMESREETQATPKDSTAAAPDLSPEEAEELSALMEPFASSNPREIAAAKAELIKKGKDTDVFGFLEANLDTMNPESLPAALEVMAEVSPEQASRVLAKRATSGPPESRAKAIELLGQQGGAGNAATFEQALRDADPLVQQSAAKALAKSGNRSATDALLESLKSPNLSVRAEAQKALKEIWKDDPAAAHMRNLTQWENFWNKREAAATAPAKADNGKGLEAEEAEEEKEAHPYDALYHGDYRPPISRLPEKDEKGNSRDRDYDER